MPTDMTKYPKNWQQIRNQILLRAGGNATDPRVGARCEWCGVKNYSVGYRLDDGSFILEMEFNTYKSARDGANTTDNCIVIVLTIAHIHDPNPMNCDPDNLKALCQRCHNNHDAPMRIMNAKKTARQKLIDEGQLLLPI